MDIEKLATSAIENLLSRNSYLRTFIDSNDKTPIWDGDVFVYKNKNFNKKNEDLIGRVPVQVKGHKSDSIEKEKIKFRIDLESVKKFNADGGVIFLVVYITQHSEKIYYNSLLPLDLARLESKYNKQKTLEIELKTLPIEEKVLADIFLDFIQNSKKQLSTLIPSFLYINDIEKIRNEVKQFKFSFSTVEPKSSIPFKELTTRDIYVYMEPRGIGNPIPIDKISNAIVNLEHKLEVAVGGQVYYDDAYVQWKNGVPILICGEAVRLFLPYLEEAGLHNLNFKIIFKGTLNKRLRDLNFVKSMIENKELSINNHIIPFEHCSLEDMDDLYTRIDNLQLLKGRLEYYGVKTDLNLDIITDEDDIKLSIIVEEYPSMKNYNIDLSKSSILRMKIANILILLMVEEDRKKECYKLKDFFTSNLEVRYILNETKEQIPMSQFLILGKDDLLADNIDAQKIIDDIKKNHVENISMGYANSFLLEAINAYDEGIGNQSQLEYLIMNLSDWLYKETREDYIFLNLAQVKYRLGEMNNEIRDKIVNMKSVYEDNLEMLIGIFILLDEKEKAKELIDKIDEEEKKLFMTYPINHLMEMGK